MKIINIGVSGEMVSNYLYAVSVKDEAFIKMFESWWSGAPSGLFPALRSERFSVIKGNVIVEVPKCK